MARILGISKEASAAADAAESPLLLVPDSASAKELKNGDTERKWAEKVVIKNAYVKDDPNNSDRTIFNLYLQVQPGSANKSKMVFGNHYVNYTTLQSGDDQDSFMNSKSITALKSLIRATGQFLDASGEIDVNVLTAMFPEKDGGKTSVIAGKRVYANIVDRAKKPKDSTKAIDLTDRGQSIETYTPES